MSRVLTEEYEFRDGLDRTDLDLSILVEDQIAKLRTVVVYLRRSPKALERFKSFQTGLTKLVLVLDVETRWNSTFLMIKRGLKLKNAIEFFLTFLKSPAGKEEFPNVNLDQQRGVAKYFHICR